MAYDGSIKFDTSIDQKKFNDGINKLKSTAKVGFAAVGTAIGAALKVGMDFEAQMSQVGTVAMASAEDMQILSAKAKEMGETTVFSASQAGEAFLYMAQAGWKTAEMTEGIAGIMDLAAASGESLGTVSDIVTDALTAFGLAAKDSGRFADVLAIAAAASNTNVAMMGETFKYVAPLAGSLGYSVEDTAVAIGLMANSGIKAGQAGTSLRSIMTRLTKPVGEAKKAIASLGLSLTDSAGEIKPLNVLMKDLRKAFAKLDDAQKPAYAAMLGGQEAMSGLLAIVNASDKDFENLTAAIADADGAASEMAERNLDNLKGRLTLAGSAAEGLGIAIYEGIEEPLSDAVENGAEKISELTKAIKGGELQPALQKTGDLLANITSGAIDLATAALPPLTTGLSFLADNLGIIVSVGGAVVAAIGAYNAYVFIATAAQKAWNAAMLINPVGLIVGGIAAAGVAIYGVAQACKAAEDAYWNMGDSIEDAGKQFEEAKNKSQLTDEYAAEWRELKDAIASNKLPAEELAGAQQKVKDIEAWFIENYGNYISAEEEKNGIRKETVDLLQEQAAILSEIDRMELENELLEKKSNVSELSDQITELGNLNTELDDANRKYLEANNVILKATSAWNALSAEQKASGEYQHVYDQALQEINDALGENYISLTSAEEAYRDNKDAIEENKKAIDDNNTKIADGTESLQQYANGAKHLIEMDLGGTYEEAANKMSLLKGAQDEMTQQGSISAETMQNLIDAFPDLEEAQDVPAAIAEKTEELNKKFEIAEQHAKDLGTDLLGIPTDIDVNVRINVFGEEQLTGIPQYAKGTRFAKSGLSVVNERGTELIEGKDGSFRYVDSSGAALTVLNRGDRVYTAAQSRAMLKAANKKIPGFASGLNNGSTPTLARFSIAGQFKSRFGNLGKEVIQGLANGITKNKKVVTNALDELNDKMLETGMEYMEDSIETGVSYSEKAASMAAAVGQMIPENMATGMAENEEKATEQFDKMLAVLDHQRAMDIINEQEYYEGLEKLRDEYLTKGTKEYAQQTEKIYSYYNSLTDRVKNLFSEIAEAAADKLDDVQGEIDSFAEKIRGVGGLYDTIDLGGGREYKRLRDLSADTEAMQKYADQLMVLRERLNNTGLDAGVVKMFFAELRDLDMAEGADLARMFNQMSDADFSAYLADYKGEYDASQTVAQMLYGDEYADAVQEINENASAEIIQFMKDELEAAGAEIPDGFFDVGRQSAENFSGSFMNVFQGMLNEIKAQFDTLSATIAPQIAYAGAGGNYSTVTNATTYNLYGNDNNDLTAQIESMETRKRMAGIGG